MFEAGVFSWRSLLVTQAEKWGFASHRKFRNASDPRAYSRTSSRFEAASISPSPKTGRNINPMYIYVPPSSSDVYLGGKITSQWICSFYRLESPSPFAWSGVRTLEEGGRRVFVMPGDDVGRSIKCTKHLLTTGNIYKTIPKLQECCRQVETELVSNSRNKIHQTWRRPYSPALNFQEHVKSLRRDWALT